MDSPKNKQPIPLQWEFSGVQDKRANKKTSSNTTTFCRTNKSPFFLAKTTHNSNHKNHNNSSSSNNNNSNNNNKKKIKTTQNALKQEKTVTKLPRCDICRSLHELSQYVQHHPNHCNHQKQLRFREWETSGMSSFPPRHRTSSSFFLGCFC